MPRFWEDEEKARYYWDRKTRQEYRISRKCLPSDSSVKAYIKIHPEVSNVSAAYEYGGFRLTGDFKQGEYKLTIGAGAKFAEGGTLFKSFDYALVVPARKPALSFNLNGRYLFAPR
jgi:hypothetical protein